MIGAYKIRSIVLFGVLGCRYYDSTGRSGGTGRSFNKFL